MCRENWENKLVDWPVKGKKDGLIIMSKTKSAFFKFDIDLSIANSFENLFTGKVGSVTYGYADRNGEVHEKSYEFNPNNGILVEKRDNKVLKVRNIPQEYISLILEYIDDKLDEKIAEAEAYSKKQSNNSKQRQVCKDKAERERKEEAESQRRLLIIRSKIEGQFNSEMNTQYGDLDIDTKISNATTSTKHKISGLIKENNLKDSDTELLESMIDEYAKQMKNNYH